MDSTPPTDADRALFLARRSTYLLGLASALFGLVMIVAFGYLNRYQRFRPMFISVGLAVWFAPGVIFLTSTYYLKQRRPAGAILGIAMAVFQGVCAAALLVASLTLPPVSPIPIIISLFWLLALGQLVLHLRRALRAIRADTSAQPGFQIEAPRPVIPLAQPAESTSTDNPQTR